MASGDRGLEALGQWRPKTATAARILAESAQADVVDADADSAMADVDEAAAQARNRDAAGRGADGRRDLVAMAGRGRAGIGLGATIAAAAWLLAACNAIDVLIPSPVPRPGESRQWIIAVSNASAVPARLFVALDEKVMGRSVGTVVPNTVAAGVTRDVIFTVPSGNTVPPGIPWAIFVNPGPNVGPLILSSDVPSGFSGRVPATIQVSAAGEISYTTQGPSVPGWFGNR